MKVSGVSLHCYRYAWAERAKTCGYPERFAMENLGHGSNAVTRAYATQSVTNFATSQLPISANLLYDSNVPIQREPPPHRSMNAPIKSLIIAIFVGVLLAATAIVSCIKGRSDVWIAEFKIYDANLIKIQHFETNAAPELKEFMKSRYYYLANKIPTSWLGNPYDYGQVETNSMHFVAGKDDTGPRYEYQLFKAKPLIFRDPETGKQLTTTK